MSLRRSLRGQILTLLGGSMILILLIALACFHFLSGGIQSYRTLVNGTLEASSLVDEANLEFKVQVQEWKNVLLRGKDPESLAKYWAQFEAQEARVQAVLGRLKEKAGELDDAALQAKVDSLRNEHRDLDDAITRLQGSPQEDELLLRRLKKRKLALKDRIAVIQRMLDPDELA